MCSLQFLCNVLLNYFLLISEAKTTEQVPDQVIVSGVLHKSIELSSHIMLPHPVEEVDWHFRCNGSTHKIARFENNQQKFYPPELIFRLEILNNGTTFRISDLRMEDSGQYIAYIILTDQKIRQAYFLLTVYDPVPPPSLTIEYKNETSHQCNVTLHCSVPANISGLSYSWKYSQQVSDYQLFNSTEDTIQMSLQPQSSWDFLCTVYNPADHKDVLLQVTCDAEGVAASLWYLYLRLLYPIALLMMVSGVIWKIRSNGLRLRIY
ncbi:SLAM family member 9-like [Hyperolius riggenbachi]|uniref:SLAM family member 9-like n=1 Tax=Hyperolius riggenbachi TaxID=752182 RepID=UPI0035A38716